VKHETWLCFGHKFQENSVILNRNLAEVSRIGLQPGIFGLKLPEVSNRAGIFGLNLAEVSRIGPSRWNLRPETFGSFQNRIIALESAGILSLPRGIVSGWSFRVFEFLQRRRCAAIADKYGCPLVYRASPVGPTPQLRLLATFFISYLLCLILGAGPALQFEFIDPDKARAAASVGTNAASSTSDPAAAAVQAASSAPSGQAPSLLIHATSAGERIVTPGAAAADRATESGAETITHISELFKSTKALPVIYYWENERSVAKRARLGDQRARSWPSVAQHSWQ
jgi:hypothetical protein